MGVKRDWISTLTSFEGYMSLTPCTKVHSQYHGRHAVYVRTYVCNSLAYVCTVYVASWLSGRVLVCDWPHKAPSDHN